MFKTILIPVDGSDSAKRAAAVGREFAQRYDARLEVLHVLEDQSRLSDREGDQGPEENDREILDEIHDLVTGDDIEINTHLAEGQNSTLTASSSQLRRWLNLDGFDVSIYSL